jgi:hypothetical protein
MIAMYARVHGFKEGAVTALYNDQQITDLDSLRELDDPTIKELCRQIGKGRIASSYLYFGKSTCGAPLAGWMTCPKLTTTKISSTSRPRRPLRIAWTIRKSPMPPR